MILHFVYYPASDDAGRFEMHGSGNVYGYITVLDQTRVEARVDPTKV